MHHDLLLVKVYHLGVRGFANQWVKSSGQASVVVFDHGIQCRSKIKISYGVDGHILFVIYITDLSN